LIAAYLPQHQLLATCAADHTIRFWATNTVSEPPISAEHAKLREEDEARRHMTGPRIWNRSTHLDTLLPPVGDSIFAPSINRSALSPSYRQSGRDTTKYSTAGIVEDWAPDEQLLLSDGVGDGMVAEDDCDFSPVTCWKMPVTHVSLCLGPRLCSADVTGYTPTLKPSHL
jgi:hypothetical protein